jgi:hypothetical protein
MPAGDAMRLVFEELVLDGIPQRNLATFVTTWMEPEAQRVIAGNLHRPTTSRPCARSSSSRSGTAWRTRSPPTSRRRARRLSKGGLHELDRKRVKTGTGY